VEKQEGCGKKGAPADAGFLLRCIKGWIIAQLVNLREWLTAMRCRHLGIRRRDGEEGLFASAGLDF
jgi:hypothetical protein